MEALDVFPQPPTANVSMGPGGTGGHTTGNLNDCVPPTSMMQSQMSNGEIVTQTKRGVSSITEALLYLPACSCCLHVSEMLCY